MDSYFVAIVPSAEARESIPAFTNLENLHITLAYLGQKSPQEIEEVKRQLYQISLNTSTFGVSGNNFSTFRGNYPHLAIKKTENLIELKNRLNQKLNVSLQFPTFNPHITISKSNLEFLPEDKEIAFEAKSIVLYKSTGFDKPYESVASFPLKDRNVLQKAVDWVKNVLL